MRDAAGSERGFATPSGGIATYGRDFLSRDGTRGLAPLRHTLTSRNARRWYMGSSFQFAWLLFLGYEYFASGPSVSAAVLQAACIVIFGLALGVSGPLAQWLPFRDRLWVAIGLWGASFLLWPMLGWNVVNTWPYVGAIIGVSLYRLRTSFLLIAGLTLLVVVFEFLSGTRSEAAVLVPAITASVSVMVVAYSRQIAAVTQLRATQQELSRLAVEKERGRVARDVHDILGHSLTAITVRAELAGLLIATGKTARAAVEIATVEDLARGALADVRSTVSGYRGVTVVSELANAKSILVAAGIEADLPTAVDGLLPQYRELAGWVVREGVTNVVRHSGASLCRIRISNAGVEVDDDGSGPVSRDEVTSTGLRGLGERVDAAGGVLCVGRSDLGGFSLSVRMPGDSKAVV